MMTSKEIRQSFLDFFKSREHRIVPSAPVIPHGDPTLLFTNAGMNQFKDVFLSVGKRDYSRAADTQKCIRVSGKHNDLEEVGVDTYHHTFFEMLGNWSFGDYYKEEAIAWAWELLTEVWGLDKSRLHATVFRTDDEAYDIWTKYLPKDRIHRFDEKDNFWEMGESGPCGPCSEIHYDKTQDKSGGHLVNAGVPEVIEIWNLVFIQYNRKADGSLEELSAKHVDTGMGFERIAAVMQGRDSNYDTDVFSPIIHEIENLSGKKYSTLLTDRDGIAMRVMADHIRTLSFSIADGALPGNEGRGYVLRRILRRGARFAKNLGFKEPVMYKLVPVLAKTMGDVFPELSANLSTIERVIKAEEESFLQTLERGLEKFEDIKLRLRNSNSDLILGAEAFLLYDTFGFPLDLTELLARENGLKVDLKGFNSKMQEQKQRSRDARKILPWETELLKSIESFNVKMKPEIEKQKVELQKFVKSFNETFLPELQKQILQLPNYLESFNDFLQKKIPQNDQAKKKYVEDFREFIKPKMQKKEADLPMIESKTVFTGYTEYENEAEVLYVNENQIILDKTPFYVESGGQVSDTGYIILAGEKYQVTDVRKSGDVYVHICDREVEPLTGSKALAKIDLIRRRDIMRNHSATHLMHEALNRVLGNHIKQAGSLVAPDYLRFDFNHFEKVSDEDIRKIEEIVNEKILDFIDVETNIIPLDEAQKNSKIKMFFGDKYGDIVRAVTMDKKYSTELCGGTHVRNTSEIGSFKIISESSIAAGVRRIEAVTGKAVEKYIQELTIKLSEEKHRNDELQEKIKQLEKEINGHKMKNVKDSMIDWIENAEKIDSIRVVTQQITAESMDELRTTGENLRITLNNNGIGLIVTVINEKAQIVCVVTDDLKTSLPAGKLVGEAAKILGGGGGGKPHLATAGGKDIEKIPELTGKFSDIVKEIMNKP